MCAIILLTVLCHSSLRSWHKESLVLGRCGSLLRSVYMHGPGNSMGMHHQQYSE